MDTRIGTRAEWEWIDRDVELEHHGSIVLVRPVTIAGEQWIGDNVADPMWFASAIAVEPRYVAELVEGMRASFLIVVVAR